MSVANFLKNKENIAISQARDIVTREALGRNTKESIQEFENHYEQTIRDYYSNPRLALSSFSPQLDQLDSFKPWLEELKQPANIHKYMPLIISKMFDGDPLAHNVYIMIYKALEKNELLFSSQTFVDYPALKEALSHSDAGVGSRATLNAEHWVNSDEGQEVLCAGVVYKDSIESLIGKACE